MTAPLLDALQALSDNVPCKSDGEIGCPAADVEGFIVARIRTRIIPRAAELAARDLPKVRALNEPRTACCGRYGDEPCARERAA